MIYSSNAIVTINGFPRISLGMQADSVSNMELVIPNCAYSCDENGTVKVSFNLFMNNGSEVIPFTVTATDEPCVIVEDDGSAFYRMVLRPNERTQLLRSTAFCSFIIGILTEEIDVSFTRTGGDIEVRYFIDVNGDTCALCDTSIHIEIPGASGITELIYNEDTKENNMQDDTIYETTYITPEQSARYILERAAELAASEWNITPEELQGFDKSVTVAKNREFGDYSSTLPMALAPKLHKSPRAIAGDITKFIELCGSCFDKVEVAGAGYINFWLSQDWYGGVLRDIERHEDDYGRINIGTGEKVMVEFVSANPTGPMTIGNARGAVLGDALASVFSWAGYNVEREFYLNDAGNQIDLLGKSLDARYQQLISGSDTPEVPEGGYKGDDVIELASKLREKYGDSLLDKPEDERHKIMSDFAVSLNTEKMVADLERYRVKFDTWFAESSLYKNNEIDSTVKLLEDNGLTYEKDGALWLDNKKLGADKDEVLRRANGFYTYYASDIAYHINKFQKRGFDRVIDVWGADHHGHAVRFKATCGAECVPIDPDKLDFVIMQMVRLVRDGETVKASKRTGKALTLADLLDEISVDACRFFFNAKPDTHLDFDLDLAVRCDSENPVYYVQYAHARICSLVSQLEADGVPVPESKDVNFDLLTEKPEHELIWQLYCLPNEIAAAARELDPSRINRYVIELAARFHRFYNVCRIRGEEPELAKARLKLADCTRQVIRNVLSLLNITAPEKM